MTASGDPVRRRVTASGDPVPGSATTLVYPTSLRSDACIELHTDATPPPGISLDSIRAGRWAVYTHRGPYDGIAEAYRRLFGSWLPGSGEEIDDRPCMECYHNSPLDTAPADLLTKSAGTLVFVAT